MASAEIRKNGRGLIAESNSTVEHENNDKKSHLERMVEQMENEDGPIQDTQAEVRES